jgi:2-oxoglutarate ferredoxin oxidoreductase subunit alpha
VHPKGAYFTRGSGHDKHAIYTEDAAAYQEVVDRLARKIDGARHAVPAPELHERPGARVGIISLGGCHGAVMEATDRLAARGTMTDYLRVRGFPFADAVGEFVRSHERVFVVEQNRDAQLRAMIAIETGIAPAAMTPVLDYGGQPLTADAVVGAVARHLTSPIASRVGALA